MDDRLRLLFVDDEPRVLEGISRMLRPLRHAWDVRYAGSGAEALRLLEQQRVDVVVSDMRMPGMDGVELLERVADLYPAAARLALSGHADQELLLRAVGPAHQWLAKPCDLTHLRLAIERCVQVRSLIASASLRALATRITALPTPPVLYQRMTTALRRERATLPQLADILEQDAAIAARLLQIANSAAVGAHRPVSSVTEAIQLIGIAAIRSVVLSAHLFATCPAHPAHGLTLDWLWQHGMAVATAARALARLEGQPLDLAEASFAAGLLHDSGLLLLLHHMPEETAQAIAIHRMERIPLIAAEQRVFGADHAQIGAYLLDLWGLPDPLVEAVAMHHAPGNAPMLGFPPLAAVHVADALLPDGVVGLSADLDQAWLKANALDERRDAWQATVTQAIGTARRG